MRHVEIARQWVQEHKLSDPVNVWSAVRSAVIASPLSDLPLVLASVQWFIEVECFTTPELQQKFDDWLQLEAGGTDLGPPSQLTELATRRQQRTPPLNRPAAELRKLVQENKTLSDQLNRLTRGLAELQGES